MSPARATLPTAAGTAPQARGSRLRQWLGEHRRAVGYAAFTLAVFLVALLYTLPHDLIARRALERATAGVPLAIAFRGVDFAFPNGYRFDGLAVTANDFPDAHLDLDSMTVRASLPAVLTGRPAADFSGELFGGELRGSAAESGPGAAIELHVEDLDLSRATTALLPTLVVPPARIAGRADIDLELTGDGRTTRSSAGEIRFAIRNLSLSRLAIQGIILPDLTFTASTGSARLAATRLEGVALHGEGPELELDLSGDVLLREPLEQSVLNLELRIETAANAQPAVRMATGFLPARPAGQPRRWAVRGTLARPTVK
jgi:type II secretion system protein N